MVHDQHGRWLYASSAALGVWLVVVAGGLSRLDPDTAVLGWALLALTTTLAMTGLFPYAGWVAAGAGAVLYAGLQALLWGLAASALVNASVGAIGLAGAALLSTAVARQFSAVTRQLERNRKIIEELSVEDPGTRLIKWQYARQTLESEIARSRRYRTDLSVLLMRVRNWSDLVEEHGPAGAEALMTKVADILILRMVDTPALFDDITVGAILPETSAEDAQIAARRLLEVVAHEARVTLYAGIAHFPEDAVTGDELIRSAEEALEFGLASGRSVVSYNQIHKPVEEIEDVDSERMRGVEEPDTPVRDVVEQPEETASELRAEPERGHTGSRRREHEASTTYHAGALDSSGGRPALPRKEFETPAANQSVFETQVRILGIQQNARPRRIKKILEAQPTVDSVGPIQHTGNILDLHVRHRSDSVSKILEGLPGLSVRKIREVDDRIEVSLGDSIAASLATVRREPLKPKIVTLLLFAYIWLMVGFSTGTGTLIGPVRWITSWSRTQGWAQSSEDLVVNSVIFLYVLFSAVISWWLLKKIQQIGEGRVKGGVLLAVTFVALGALWLWLNPGILTRGEQVTFDSVSRFTFGPYPTRERFVQLKEEGYTAVISLLHPAVVPFEPKLLADERAIAEEVGIEFIHAPMLPWVGENEESLATIRQIALTGEGRYYVHCYLGKDRVNVVKRLVEQAGVSMSVESIEEARQLSEITAFERGKIWRLEDQVYLTPYPTEEEFFTFILTGEVKQVVSLLDPANFDNVTWIDKEREILAKYDMPFELSPIPTDPYDPNTALEAAQKVRVSPRPVVVHAFLSDSSVTEAFLQAYRAQVPPLPPSLFQASMERGIVQVIAPNIAVGPRPASAEFSSYLRPRGVRGIVFVGPPEASEAQQDRVLVPEAGLEWQVLPAGDSSLLEVIKTGGPWYLYGPELSGIQQTIKDRLGPAVPDGFE